MDVNELKELIRLIEASGLSEIEIEEGGRRIRLVKPSLPEARTILPVAPDAEPDRSRRSATLDNDTEALLAEGLITIDSPMVGTFHAAAGAGESPFVHPGDTVDAGQVVCIVEAMKIVNEVVCKVPAIIERILVRNGEAVEYGQPLIAVRPLA